MQPFTLTINEAPTITTGTTALFTVGQGGGFHIKTSGFPTPTFDTNLLLPAGLTLSNLPNGEAVIGGTPQQAGVFQFTLTAHNGVSPNATQAFTIIVSQAPTITSAAATSFRLGSPGTFTVTTSPGFPGSTTLSATNGSGGDPGLPAGITFVDNGNGTATLSGTSMVGGKFTFSVVASNGPSSQTVQIFTLTIDQAPTISSAASTTFGLGQTSTFTVKTNGNPAALLSEAGALPTGVFFVDNGDGTATLAGVPTAAGVFSLVFTATNGLLPNGTQNFTLTVTQPPVVTSVDNTTFEVGVSGVLGTGQPFAFTTSGTVAQTITATDPATGGAPHLPPGVVFTDNGNGTASLGGIPQQLGVFVIQVNFSNGATTTQIFTITVDQIPAITSAAATTFAVNEPNSFNVTTSGFPTAAFNVAAVNALLPPGLLLVDNSDGTATLSGSPTASGTFTLTIVADNGVSPAAVQQFVLTVPPAPTITSDNFAIFTVGQPGTFTVTTAPGIPDRPLTLTVTDGTIRHDVRGQRRRHGDALAPTPSTAGD